MPVVPCPHCSNSVSLPSSWSGSAYTCPHCSRVVTTSAPPRERKREREPEPEEDDFDVTPRPRRKSSNSAIVDLLTFRLMITPVLIQVVFWIGTLLCVGQGLLLVASSFNGRADGPRLERGWDDDDRPLNNVQKQKANTPGWKFLVFASGVATMTFGPLVVRLYCELLIIIFKIHGELKTMNDRRSYRT